MDARDEVTFTSLLLLMELAIIGTNMYCYFFAELLPEPPRSLNAGKYSSYRTIGGSVAEQSLKRAISEGGAID